MDAAIGLFASRGARALVLAAASVLALVRLGASDLWPPDEPRWALVAEELRSFEQGWRGLVLLHLHDVPYTQKPPLYFWLAAAAGAAGGSVTEAAARLPSALAGVAAVAVTMALGGLLFGRAAGTLAGALLVTTVDWSWRARTVQLDTLLALWELAALLAYARFERGVGSLRRNVASLHGALGLAVLAKGPVGLAVPLLAIAAQRAWERRLRALPALFPAWSWLLSLGPGAAWIAGAAALAPAGFFRAAVVENVFGRAFGDAAHAQPFWFYLEKFPIDLLPWILLLPATIATARRALADPHERSGWRLVLAWIATSALVFSLASGKRVRYLLPLEPAFALLFAATLRAWLAGAVRAPRGLAVLAVALAAAALAGAAWLWIAAPAPLAEVARPSALAAASIAGAGALGWSALARRGATPGAFVALLAACVWLAQLFAYTAAIPALDATRSPRPLAAAVAAVARPGERVALYRAADVAHAIAYYGHRELDVFRAEERLAAFLAGGGRVLVFEEERLPVVESFAPVTVRERRRVAGETWLVAVAREAGG